MEAVLTQKEVVSLSLALTNLRESCMRIWSIGPKETFAKRIGGAFLWEFKEAKEEDVQIMG